MSKKDDGGLAFPHAVETIRVDTYGGARDQINKDFHGGMTLRDYFAGQALAGFRSQYGMAAFSHEIIATRSYAAADAMIKERNKDE